MLSPTTSTSAIRSTRRLVQVAILGITAFVLALPDPGQCQRPESARLAVPDAAAQVKAEKLIRELFKDDYAKKKPAELLALADQLLEQARATRDDPAARFVLFREAADLLNANGATDRALRAIDEQVREYDADAIALKTALLDKASRRAPTPAEQKVLVEAMLGVIDEAVAADAFTSLMPLLTIADGAAAKAKNVPLVKAVQAKAQAVELLAREHQRAQLAITTLAKKADDPEANATAGRYQCLVKGQWDKGLLWLAHGNDARLKALAEKELMNPATAADQVALADAWFELAEAEKPPFRSGVQRRAFDWYVKAAPELTGLSRTRVDRRIESLKESVTPREATGPRKLEPQLTNTVGIKLALIPAGKFTMGSPASEPGHHEDETQHEVAITKPFYLGTTEVTVGQFRAFVKATAYKTEAEKSGQGSYRYVVNAQAPLDAKLKWSSPGFLQTDDHPVVCVSWNDAVAFCAWLSKQEGRNYVLPTEAQWEYACRANTTTRFSSGEDEATLQGVANIADVSLKPFQPTANMRTWNDGYAHAAPVAKFKPNAFGLYDMHGNAMEWCADWYEKDYFKGAKEDPTGPASGEKRLARGGAWHSPPWYSRSAMRDPTLPSYRCQFIGFRVALLP